MSARPPGAHPEDILSHSARPPAVPPDCYLYYSTRGYPRLLPVLQYPGIPDCYLYYSNIPDCYLYYSTRGYPRLLPVLQYPRVALELRGYARAYLGGVGIAVEVLE